MLLRLLLGGIDVAHELLQVGVVRVVIVAVAVVHGLLLLQLLTRQELGKIRVVARVGCPHVLWSRSRSRIRIRNALLIWRMLRLSLLLRCSGIVVVVVVRGKGKGRCLHWNLGHDHERGAVCSSIIVRTSSSSSICVSVVRLLLLLLLLIPLLLGVTVGAVRLLLLSIRCHLPL